MSKIVEVYIFRRHYVTTKNIYKSYITGGSRQIALDGINLKFRESEFVTILGASGSGKQHF